MNFLRCLHEFFVSGSAYKTTVIKLSGHRMSPLFLLDFLTEDPL